MYLAGTFRACYRYMDHWLSPISLAKFSHSSHIIMFQCFMPFVNSSSLPDDEPTDGPSCYFLLTGFTSADFFKHLSQVKVAAHALVSVVGSEDFTTKQGTE